MRVLVLLQLHPALAGPAGVLVLQLCLCSGDFASQNTLLLVSMVHALVFLKVKTAQSQERLPRTSLDHTLRAICRRRSKCAASPAATAACWSSKRQARLAWPMPSICNCHLHTTSLHRKQMHYHMLAHLKWCSSDGI